MREECVPGGICEMPRGSDSEANTRTRDISWRSSGLDPRSGRAYDAARSIERHDRVILRFLEANYEG